MLKLSKCKYALYVALFLILRKVGKLKKRIKTCGRKKFSLHVVTWYDGMAVKTVYMSQVVMMMMMMLGYSEMRPACKVVVA